VTDDLDQLQDLELDQLFAIDVAGWRWIDDPPRAPRDCGAGISQVGGATLCDPSGVGRAIPRFTTDANAVLPLLERMPFSSARYASCVPHHWDVIVEGGAVCAHATGVTFPRAAVIALIRHTRAIKGGQFETT